MVRWTNLGIAVVLAQAALAAPGAAATITGTPFGDTLVGTPSNDRIHGRAGPDVITGGKGDDWLFGDADDDTFLWASGDGHDRIDGGPGTNSLGITAGQKLHLHFDALGAGPETRPTGDLQVIGIRNIEEIGISPGPGGIERLVVSSAANVTGGGPSLFVDTTLGGNNPGINQPRSTIDLRGYHGPTRVLGTLSGTLVSGGLSGVTVWMSDGGGGFDALGGNNAVHLGKGLFFIGVSDIAWLVTNVTNPERHDTVFGFGNDDILSLEDYDGLDIHSLDTNKDGRVDAGDQSVTVRNGSMRIDLSSGYSLAPGRVTITLVGRVSIRDDQVDLFGGG